ncbi:MAG TPA: AAA family ATPase [Phycisphaeraceae bacterium]
MTKQNSALLEPEELAPAVELVSRTLAELDAVLLGQSDLHRLVLAGILSRGHILLEGLPGVGKTALIKALGKLLHLAFNRVQFTPDLMPGDILGTAILEQGDDGRRAMRFEPGPIFTNILLADEINRASPKTQSALLEAMQERRVTTLGQTRPLPEPFFVLASQNPIELEGTYPLPEAQLDRFLFKLRVNAVAVDVLEQIIATRRRGEPPEPAWSMTAEQLASLFAVMDRVYLPRAVSRYIAHLVSATHPETPGACDAVRDYVAYGTSPRAAIAMAEAARAVALIDGRPTVGFEDVKAVAPAVLNHRLILNYKARFDKVDELTVINQALASLDAAALDLPRDVRLDAVG